MGVACGDLDGDGLPDLAVTNFYGESTTLFQNLGGGSFADRTAAVGLAAPSRHVLGFGAAFLDADNDGRLDLATANGHVNDYRPSIPYAMPAQLFLGTRRRPARRRLRTAPGPAGEHAERRPGPGRRRPRQRRPAGPPDRRPGRPAGLLPQPRGRRRAGHSLTLRLEGTSVEPRRASAPGSGSTASGRPQVAQRIGGGSFLSACDGRLHFGLGAGDAGLALRRGPLAGRPLERHDGLRPTPPIGSSRATRPLLV